ncbi:MAG TPA: hypothetical protein VFU46_13395 [Gemmatimonadales bacterium]|nr:hypothetical protein [Gemmatimonadales bacterium]
MIGASLVAALLLAPGTGPDTIRVRLVDRSPDPTRLADTAAWGPPQVRFPGGQGAVSVWLLRRADSMYVVASIPDSTIYWGDDLVVSLDTGGDRAAPGPDDFQWDVRRVVDSSVVYRGRDGKWAAPRDDPDWRMGEERSGGGWDLRTHEGSRGWAVVLRLDAFDSAPHGWHAWPAAPFGSHPTVTERVPELWAPLRTAGG